ncbi:MAG TPA: phosphatidylglycerophosphatase A [Pyrinomonadaceae bacterium]|nr:phosphatidylglycerophosphatase A [Pyrinomonadaceae bacterium]
MAIKESTDELSPGVSDGAAVVPRSARSATDYLALIIATCGVGYFPIAPGTWGSMVGVGLFLLYRWLLFKPFQASGAVDVFHQSPAGILVAGMLVVITFVTLAGIWAGSRVEKLSSRKDPGKVVIDEVAGQLIALLPAVPMISPQWWLVVSSFLLFRFFDIVKPYPARKFERLPAGLGIMCDDLVAGAYAAVGTFVIIMIVR